MTLKTVKSSVRTQLFPALAFSYWAVFPAVTFILLWLKGLPSFTQGRLGRVIVWSYEAGMLLALVVWIIVRRTKYFHQPYDFGRCFSLGAVLGAVIQALSTWLYRFLTHHPFSDFWIAGAMIAGCLTGAFLTAFFLRRASHSPTV
jgi:hypothetical protein